MKARVIALPGMTEKQLDLLRGNIKRAYARLAELQRIHAEQTGRRYVPGQRVFTAKTDYRGQG